MKGGVPHDHERQAGPDEGDHPQERRSNQDMEGQGGVMPPGREEMNMLNLNQSAISQANAASMFDAGSVLAREADRTYTEGVSKMQPEREKPLNERQSAILAERLEGWKGLVEKAYNDIIAKRGAWMPWTVCGPARYNSRRNSAKADRQMDAEREWSDKLDRYIVNTLSMIADAIPHDELIAEYRSGKRRESISSDDPDALEKLSARLEGMQERHEEAKRQNAYWRKHGTMKGYPGVTDDEAARRDAEINAAQLPCWRVPYHFSANDTAEMRRIRERIEDIERQREAGNTQKEYDGFTIERADGRINIAFDAKPEVEARDILKSNGFRWSPKAHVWTRKLTDNAVYAVDKFVVPGLLALYNEDVA